MLPMVSRPKSRRYPRRALKREQLLRHAASAATGSRSAIGSPSKSSRRHRAAVCHRALAGSIGRGRLERRARPAIRACAASHPCPRPFSEWRSRDRARSDRGCAAAVRTDRRCRSRPPASRPGRRDRRAAASASGRCRAREDVLVRMQLVGSGQRTRTRHRHRVSPAGAALGGEQVVPAVALVEMRRFGEAQARALEDVLALADQLALRDASIPAARCRRSGCCPGR